MAEVLSDHGLWLSLPGQKSKKRNTWIFPALCMALALILLLIIPSARHGVESLCNQLFDASEAVNQYAYSHFSVSPETNTDLATILLVIIGICWISIVFLCPSRLPALLTALVLSAAQAYFGLSLPIWVLIPLYGALAFRMTYGMRLRNVSVFILVILVITAGIIAFWPGVDEATETASERVRDALGRPAASSADTGGESPDQAYRETRHVNCQSLEEGSDTANPEQSYRLVTVEEQQISMPRWIDYLKIALLLLLAIAALVLPFLPSAAMNARRKKALEARAAFDAKDNSVAVCAMFRHVMRYLDVAEGTSSNTLFRLRADDLRETLPEEFRARCQACVPLFEEAAYSDHPIQETARDQVRSLLDETEVLFYDRAGWRQRLRLRYRECLHL